MLNFHTSFQENQDYQTDDMHTYLLILDLLILILYLVTAYIIKACKIIFEQPKI